MSNGVLEHIHLFPARAIPSMEDFKGSISVSGRCVWPGPGAGRCRAQNTKVPNVLLVLT